MAITRKKRPSRECAFGIFGLAIGHVGQADGKTFCYRAESLCQLASQHKITNSSTMGDITRIKTGSMLCRMTTKRWLDWVDTLDAEFYRSISNSPLQNCNTRSRYMFHGLPQPVSTDRSSAQCRRHRQWYRCVGHRLRKVEPKQLRNRHGSFPYPTQRRAVQRR